MATADDTFPCVHLPHVTLYASVADPLLLPVLRMHLKNHQPLLHVARAGIPAWALALPRWGVFYRPWMRQAAAYVQQLLLIATLAAALYELTVHAPAVYGLVAGGRWVGVIAWLR